MEQLKTSEHIVSFIDVLGAKNAILEDADASLNKVHRAYENAMKLYKTLTKNSNNTAGKMKYAIFSDNIVFALPVSDNIRDSLYLVTVMSASMQVELLKQDPSLSRGGISKGSFFTDDVMVWGKALVDAYNIEKEISKKPRIVLDDCLKKYVILKDGSIANWFEKDEEDGRVYVDYLNKYIQKMDKSLNIEATIKTSEMQRNQAEDILKKHKWFQQYAKRKQEEGADNNK